MRNAETSVCVTYGALGVPQGHPRSRQGHPRNLHGPPKDLQDLPKVALGTPQGPSSSSSSSPSWSSFRGVSRGEHVSNHRVKQRVVKETNVLLNDLHLPSRDLFGSPWASRGGPREGAAEEETFLEAGGVVRRLWERRGRLRRTIYISKTMSSKTLKMDETKAT